MDTGTILRRSKKLLLEIESLSGNPILSRNKKPEVKEAVNKISFLLGKIHSAIEQDEDKREEAYVFLSGYIEPVHSILRQYVKLSAREVEPAKPQLDETEKELPIIQGRLQTLYERMHEGDIVNLAVLNEMVEESLLVDESHL